MRGEGARPAREIFYTLDGMRGLAAILVVVRHFDYDFRPLTFWSSFLAVDIFFVMSGVVVAQAYGRKLAEGTLSRRGFLLVRIVRLWPLYLLGTAIGVAALALGLLDIVLEPGEIAMVAAVAPFMLPSPLPGLLFPANLPAWSLFFEALVNVAFAATARRLRTRWLIAATAAGGLGCLVALVTGGTLNRGFGNAPEDFAIGIARVLFDFGAGILIYRFGRRGGRRLPAALPLALSVAVLVMPARIGDTWPFLFGVPLLAIPLTVLAGVNSRPGPRLAAACRWLGTLSYAVYVLHYPLLWLMHAAIAALPPGAYSYPPGLGLCELPALLLAAWAADRWFDVPVRRWLSSRLQARGAATIAARAAATEAARLGLPAGAPRRD